MVCLSCCSRVVILVCHVCLAILEIVGCVLLALPVMFGIVGCVVFSVSFTWKCWLWCFFKCLSRVVIFVCLF